MTTKLYLHIGFSFEDRQPPHANIKNALDKAFDWVRYAPNCYIVYTARDVEYWYRVLRDLIDDGDNLFVVELNIKNRQGWLSRSTWDWIRKDRD